MNPFFVFLIELFIVFISSRFIFRSLFMILLIATRKEKIAISGVSFLFFIGTAIHELSHMFMAELLQVKTHGMELVPQFHNGRLKMGSVQVEESDFFRQFLIGIAPLIVGCMIILSSLWLLSRAFSLFSLFSSPLSIVGALVVLFLLFVISNSMFSSKKDMEGAVELLILVIVFEIGAFFIHVPVNDFLLSLIENKQFIQVMHEVVILFAIPPIINILALLLFFIFFKKKRLM